MHFAAERRRLVRRGYRSATDLLDSRVLAARQHRHRQEAVRPPVNFAGGRSVYHVLTIAEIKRVIYNRYGNLDDFTQPPVKTYAAIAKQLRLPISTVVNVLRRFVSRDHDLDKLQVRRRQFAMITPAVKAALLNTELLQRWSPYTMRERVEIIHRTFDVSLCIQTLQRFYKKFGIAHRAAKVRYRYEQVESVLMAERRKAFAVLLGNLLDKKAPLLWLDETTFCTGKYLTTIMTMSSSSKSVCQYWVHLT